MPEQPQSDRSGARDRGIPWDESHADRIRGTLDELNMECPEGSEIRGRPARYILVLKEGSCFITEDSGNHPSRKRFMAGSVDETCFGIDSGGKITDHQ